MKKFIVLSIIVCTSLVTNAEDIKKQGTCAALPMKAATMWFSDPNPIDKPSQNVLVSATDSKVFSLTPGVVVMETAATDIFNKKFRVIAVQYNTDTFIAYSNIHDPSVKLGDIVKKGQLLGTAEKSSTSDNYETNISVRVHLNNTDTNNIGLTATEVAVYIERLNQ
jgi:Na+-transporting NADH:ubiquinone oxidoreductase subunit NqrA